MEKSGVQKSLRHAFRRPAEMAVISFDTMRQLGERGQKFLGRNTKCPCGSGRRFKRCCMIRRRGARGEHAAA